MLSRSAFRESTIAKGSRELVLLPLSAGSAPLNYELHVRRSSPERRRTCPPKPWRRRINLALIISPSDVEDYPAAEVNNFASGGRICQQVALVGHRNKGGAIKDRDAPQPEGLATSLQIGTARRLRPAKLNPKVGDLTRENRIGYYRNKAHVSSGVWIAVEVLSRPSLSERELLLGQVTRRNREIARIDARARCHATGEHYGHPQ